MTFSYEEHTADIKIRATGADLGSALVAAARACTNLLTPVDNVKETVSVAVSVTGEKPEDIAFAFLQEVVFLLDTKHFVASGGELTFIDGKLSGVLRGDSIRNYERHGDIKAPTYHALSVQTVHDLTIVTFVMDI